MRMRPFLVAAALLPLAACGSGGAPAGNDGAAAPKVASKGGVFAAGWNVADACTILPKEDVARVLGVFVEHTETTGVSEMTEDRAGFSICNYVLPDDKRVAFMARMSPEADNTPAAMKKARDETADALGGAEDVPNLGRSAFWLPKMRQIVMFVGDNRYMNLTLPKGVDDATAKKQAIALAQTLQ